MQTITLTINEAGLTVHTVTVNAESTVAVVERDSGVNLWISLLIDGRHYDLVAWKHTVGRPEHLVAVEQARAAVEAAIASLQTPPAPEPTASEAAVCGALERLADENARSARLARAQGLADDARFFQRAATSYANALIEYRRGVRPERLPSGAWLLPSRRAGEAPHIVRMDGDWICDCKAAGSMHWPIALVIGIEVAGDDLDRFDCGETAAGLGRRLAVARARMLAA